MAKPIYNFDAIHGRDSLRAKVEVGDGTGELDIGSHPVWLEVPASHLRKQLFTDTADGDPLAVALLLTRAEVESLPTTPTPYAVIDEVNLADGFPNVLFYGTISRTGYTGSPLDTLGGQ